MCAGQADQLACALDDLKDSFAKIQDVVDFLSAEAATDSRDWPRVRVTILVDALEAKLAGFCRELSATAMLAREQP